MTQEKTKLETEVIAHFSSKCNQAQAVLRESKEKADAIASASEAWVQQQTALTHKIAALQQILNPQRTEQAQLKERYTQLQSKIIEQTNLLASIEQEITAKQVDATTFATQVTDSEQQIQTLEQRLATVEQERTIQQDTLNRLLKEQREKQRQLDKLEATSLAQQEAQGTYATKVLLNANLAGICGLVAQLGQVDPRYQLALETAAGGRLGYLVVEDDTIAATGIELLKQKTGGTSYFLTSQ